jgi:hypothetical protein
VDGQDRATVDEGCAESRLTPLRETTSYLFCFGCIGPTQHAAACACPIRSMSHDRLELETRNRIPLKICYSYLRCVE